MADVLDRYLIIISTLWHCWYFCYNSFQLGSNSQISKFWGHAPLILQSQGTNHPLPLKNPRSTSENPSLLLLKLINNSSS